MHFDEEDELSDDPEQDDEDLGFFLENQEELEKEIVQFENTRRGEIESWKNKEYFLLPENVRKAVDIAQEKS